MRYALIASTVRRVAACCFLAGLAGCAAVNVAKVDTRAYVIEQRGDVLSTGVLSRATTETLRALGVGASACELAPRSCAEAVSASELVGDEQRLSALAELWLQVALRFARAGEEAVHPDALRNAWLETARHAYAFLFFTGRRPPQRAFEDRQTQVLDYYNFAATQAIALIFPRYADAPPAAPVSLTEGRWTLHVAMLDARRDRDRVLPKALLPATSLQFAALRNTYRRDGLGAELVAVVEGPGDVAAARPFSEMHARTITGILLFRGSTLAEVLRTGDIDFLVIDPYRRESVEIAGTDVPVAANFTAGYGLWLAQSGFSRRAIRGVLGRPEGVAAPHVFLMQPFDPDRRVVVTMHGLASSPEAWVNVTNEVLGDATLRGRFQVWQVTYPTNAPILFNRRGIEEAIEATLRHHDPAGTSRASRDAVLVGHSMGGVLARLLVSSSGEALRPEFIAETGLDGAALEKALAEFDPFLAFKPMPQVTRAVFIAAPHRGTPFANRRVSRWAANLIALPYDVLEVVTDLNRRLAGPGGDAGESVVLRVPNSVENLSDRNLTLRLADTMPIAPGVTYHSIIANAAPGVPLQDSSDGVVPFASARLPGAASELVIEAGHSVQGTPQAILELRRILRLH